MSFSKTVKTKDGIEKTVVADTEEALEAAVKVAQADQSPTYVDINNPKDGNKVVSPDNTHTNEGVGGVDVNGQPAQVNRDANGHFTSNK